MAVAWKNDRLVSAAYGDRVRTRDWRSEKTLPPTRTHGEPEGFGDQDCGRTVPLLLPERKGEGPVFSSCRSPLTPELRRTPLYADMQQHHGTIAAFAWLIASAAS